MFKTYEKTKTMIFIGIDPGVNGAIAVIDDDLNVSVFQLKKHEIEDVLEGYAGRRAMACLEKVNATPQMGVVSAFTFGGAYAAVKTALRCFKIPFAEVAPTKWQSIYPLKRPPRGATSEERASYKREHKRELYRLAKDLFPEQCKSQDRADALLIMEYCRRENERLNNGAR